MSPPASRGRSEPEAALDEDRRLPSPQPPPAGDADVAAVARLVADPTRTAMCLALMDGRFHPAGELARAGGVALSTASGHLARLVRAGLLEMHPQGRHRYFRLSGPDVAAALEALAVLAPPRPVRSLKQATAGAALRAGRTCYDHLAGELGVAVTDGLVAAGVLSADLAFVTLGPLQRVGLRLPAAGRRPLARPCLDWTERRYHAAGAVPAALAARMFELGWLRRGQEHRTARLTDLGTGALRELLPAAVPPPARPADG